MDLRLNGRRAGQVDAGLVGAQVRHLLRGDQAGPLLGGGQRHPDAAPEPPLVRL